MNEAKEIVEKIRVDLRPIDEKILAHPYIKINWGHFPILTVEMRDVVE